MLLRTVTCLLVLVGVVLGACSGTHEPPTHDGTLYVVTTVSPITSIAENIGGLRIRLEGIIPEGVSSHTFEPAPYVVRAVMEADLIVLNGLFLEESSMEMIKANKKPETIMLALGEQTITSEEWQFDFSFPASGGRPNPHLWPNPIYALRYAELIHEQLVLLDPSNAEYYSYNLARFREKIYDLDKRIRDTVLTIPSGHRKLLTYHDSWAYFARRYGMEVIGAVQPSDFSQPSAREVARLIDQVRDLRLPAIFGSEVFRSKVLEQIANESGAQFVDTLRDDDLPGESGEPGHTYLGMMLENMRSISLALGGNFDALSGFDTSLVFEGDGGAIYPQ